MEFQFRYFLMDLLDRAGEPVSDLSDTCLPQLSNIEVGGVPRSVCADMSSPLCFWIASRAARESEGMGAEIPSAFAIAQSLLAGQSAGSDYGIDCEVGGDGHINARVGYGFFERYISVVSKKGVSLLLGTEDLFSEPLASDAKAWRFSGSSLLERVTEGGRDELSLLREMKEDFEVDDWLMVLALQTDPELEVRPYIDNSLGRQNVPWYMRRCLRDLDKVLQAIDVGELSSSGVSDVYSISERIGDNFLAMLSEIIRFRSIYQRARLSDRPELPIATLLSAIRAFYRFYNDPSFRKVLFDAPRLESQAFLRDSIAVLRDLILCFMELLEFPCGNRSFVLHL
jgi:hypothetical protein